MIVNLSCIADNPITSVARRIRRHRGTPLPADGHSERSRLANRHDEMKKGALADAPKTYDLKPVTCCYSVRSMLLLATREAPYTLFSVGGGATKRTTCCSRSGWNGLAMQTTAPN